MKKALFPTLFISLLATATATDWPQWRGPNRDGIAPVEIQWPEGGPKVLWKASVGSGYSSVSVANGRVYTMGNDGKDIGIGEKWRRYEEGYDREKDKDTVWCLDAKTGEVIWKYEYQAKNASPNYPGPRTTPTVDGDLVYTLSYDGKLKALKTATGELVWSADYVKDFGARIAKSNRHGFSGSPLVEGDLLITHPGAKGASVVAFDKKTGKVVWRSGDDPASFSSPIIFTHGGRRMVAMFSASGLHAYELADGKPLWNVPWENDANLNAPDPVIVGDKLFITASNNSNKGAEGEGCALIEIIDGIGKPVYERTDKETLSSQCGTPVLIDGYLYGPTGRINFAKLICVDPATGDIKWRNDAVQGHLVAAGKQQLVIQSLKGEIILAEASPEGYKEIARTAEPILTGECWTPPTVANGRIYCRNTAGDVVCLELTP